MAKDIVVTRSTFVNTHAARVWEVLTQPMLTKQYMFNCEVCSDWQRGSSITWEGTFQHQQVFQKGEILDIVPGRLLKYTTFDPHSGAEDKPENYVVVSYTLVPLNGHTELMTTLSNFGGDAIRAEQAAWSWDFEVLPKLKAVAEAPVLQMH